MNLTVEKYIAFVKLDNLIDKYVDRLEYDVNRDWFSNIVCKHLEMLINDSETINETINFIGDYIREIVEMGIIILLQDVSKRLTLKTERKTIYLKKQLDVNDVSRYIRLLDDELKVMAKANHPRLWASLGVSYGQGAERALSELNVSPQDIPWERFRETAIFKEQYFKNLKYITNDLGHHIKGIVAVGVTEGLHPYDIARRLREVKINPKIVTVEPKIVAGKVVRRGYQFTIPEKRYAEIIARTESARAITQGRVDVYKRTGISQVRFLSAGDERVCSECMSLDGQIFNINVAPLIPLHANCRCDLVCFDKGWTPTKIKEDVAKAAIVDKMYSSHFSESVSTRKEFEGQVKNFKKEYTGLSSLERKAVLRQAVRDFKQIGAIPKVVATSGDDMAQLFLMSKRIKATNPKILNLIKQAQGSKPTVIYIGEKAALDKALTSPYKTYLAQGAKQSNMGGGAWSAQKMSKLSRTQTLGELYYKYGQDRNEIYIASFEKSFNTTFSVVNIQAQRNLFHELGHTVWYNDLTQTQRKNWTEIYESIQNSGGNFITTYAKTSPAEYFAEAFSAKSTGILNFKHTVSKQYFDDLVR